MAAFHPPLGLRGMGGDHLDAEFTHGMRELGFRSHIGQFLIPPGLTRAHIDTVAVWIQCRGQAVALHIALEDVVGRRGVFRGIEPGQRRGRGVINHHHEHGTRTAAFKPIMLRAIDLDQIASARAALA